jgi:hypothetical protein
MIYLPLYMKGLQMIRILVPLVFSVAFSASACHAQETVRPQRSTTLRSALRQISKPTRALVLLDTRLDKLIAPDLAPYIKAASARRGFRIAVLPIVNLDDCRPPEKQDAEAVLNDGILHRMKIRIELLR